MKIDVKNIVKKLIEGETVTVQRQSLIEDMKSMMEYYQNFEPNNESYRNYVKNYGEEFNLAGMIECYFRPMLGSEKVIQVIEDCQLIDLVLS